VGEAKTGQGWHMWVVKNRKKVRQAECSGGRGEGEKTKRREGYVVIWKV